MILLKKLLQTENKANNDYKNFEFELITTFSMSSPITENEFLESSEDDLINNLFEELNTFYRNKKELNRTLAFPVIKNVMKTRPIPSKEL